MPTTITEALFGCVLALFPVALIRHSIGAQLFGGCGSAFLGSAVSGLIGVYLTWHAGMSTTLGKSFSPLWGLVPVAIGELHSYLQTLFNLKNDCVQQSGDRFVLPDGAVIRLPMTASLVGLIAALIEAIVILQTGTGTMRDGLVSFYQFTASKVLLSAGGFLVILSTLGLVRKIASLPDKG